ncbi:hypothetical protein D3C72_1265490 [compost metagenome]
MPVKFTDAPSTSLPTVSTLLVASCCTSPVAPLVMLESAVLMSPMSCVLFSMLVVLIETCWLVACSCAPFTASVLAAESAPAFTPVSVRAPAVPVKFTDVPFTSLPTVSTLLAASCCTRPALPVAMLLIAVVLFWMFVELVDTC